MIKYLAIHHTAVSRDKQRSQLRAVDVYHKEKFGLKSSLGWWVGYCHFIDVDGTGTQTRTYTEEQCAIIGHNCDVESRCDTISVCLAGDFNQELPLPDQIEQLRKTYRRILMLYPGIQIRGHRDLQIGRTCPGELLTDDYIATMLSGGAKPDSDDAEKQRKQAEITALQKLIHILTQWLIARGVTPVQ